MLGLSLSFFLERFEDESIPKLQRAEWRDAGCGPTTRAKQIRPADLADVSQEKLQRWFAAQPADPPADPTFIQMAPVLTYGEDCFGYGRICPRDGKLHCSVVDAVHHRGDSGKADQYLSWVWGYRVSTVKDAFRAWVHDQQNGDKEVHLRANHIWWCFFVNNQNRMQQTQSPDALAEVFKTKLLKVGRMLMLLDVAFKSQYASRIWCVFELFVASTEDVPCVVMLPPVAAEEVVQLETITEVLDACQVDAESAKASVANDENQIKELIRKKYDNFDKVNRVVEKALWCHLLALKQERRKQLVSI